MHTSPDGDEDDDKLVAQPLEPWEPQWVTERKRENNQHTFAVPPPEYDNQEFQQTSVHAAEAARSQAGAGRVARLQSSERTTGHHHRVNAYPVAAGVAEEGLKNWGDRRAQVSRAPVPAQSLNQQRQELLLPRQPTNRSTQPDHCAAGAEPTGQSKQRARAGASGSQRSAAATSTDVQVHQRMPAASTQRAAAKVSAERKRGAQLVSSSSRRAGPRATILPSVRGQTKQNECQDLFAALARHVPAWEIVAHAVAHISHAVAHACLSHISQVSHFAQLGPAGFAQLVVAVERAGVAARPPVVREPTLPPVVRELTRPAAKRAEPPPPKLPPNKQPRLAPSSSTGSSPPSVSPPPSPPSKSTSPPLDARKEGPWTPEESAELIDWLFHV